MTGESGRCETCPTLTTSEERLAELQHHAREVIEAATPQAMRRLRVILDLVDPDEALAGFLREAALTIIDGHECHPDLDALHGATCHCRAEGEVHAVGVADTYEALAALVDEARRLYDERKSR